MKNRKEFLEERRAGIGSSDSAAICGLSKWATPFDIWQDKLALKDEQPDNDAMAWGRMLEPVIRQKYADERGVNVVVPGQMRSTLHPFAIANLDGIAEDRVLEVKTARTAEGWGEPGTDEVPQTYLIQVQHQMIVSGLSLADIAVLIGGQDYRVYTVVADTELQDILMEKEAEFWEMVRTKTPPPPVSFDDARRQFARSIPGKVKIATDFHLQAWHDLKRIREEVAKLTADEEVQKAAIAAFLEDADTLTDADGNTLITWKSTKPGQKFDVKRFEVENKELHAKYIINTEPQRRFLIK